MRLVKRTRFSDFYIDISDRFQSRSLGNGQIAADLSSASPSIHQTNENVNYA